MRPEELTNSLLSVTLEAASEHPVSIEEVPQEAYTGLGGRFDAQLPMNFELEPGLPVFAWQVAANLETLPSSWYSELAVQPGAAEKIYIRINVRDNSSDLPLRHNGLTWLGNSSPAVLPSARRSTSSTSGPIANR